MSEPLTVFERHMSSHFASLMAIQGAKDHAHENLEGMIKSALIGTWNAAIESAAKVVAQHGIAQISEDVRALKA